MKLSVDLNPQDLFGENGTLSSYLSPNKLSEQAVGTRAPIGVDSEAQKFLDFKTLLGALILSALIYGLVEMAQYSVSGRFLAPTLMQGPLYGPAFHEKQKVKFFERVSFDQVGQSFDKSIPLWRISEFDYQTVRADILAATPKKMRVRLNRYIDLAFFYAQEYQVDPFWIISVMWVESHFNPTIRSRVDAMGLMQIMPGTAHYLNHLLKRPIGPELAVELSKDPAHNIQLGTYYLKRLMKRFNGNHVFATVSYNMGPGFTERRLRRGRTVGTRNLYLNKIRRAYRRLTREFKKRLKNEAPLYMETYAAIEKTSTLPSADFRFMSWWNKEVVGKLSEVSLARTQNGTVRL